MNCVVGRRPREILRDQEQGYLVLWHVDCTMCLSMKCEGICIAFVFLLTPTREHPHGSGNKHPSQQNDLTSFCRCS